MLIDCNECAMQDTAACSECVVTHLLLTEDGRIDLDAPEAAALGALADHGLVPVLRLVRRVVNE